MDPAGDAITVRDAQSCEDVEELPMCALDVELSSRSGGGVARCSTWDVSSLLRSFPGVSDTDVALVKKTGDSCVALRRFGGPIAR